MKMPWVILILIFPIMCVGPVSYTHLDVYKRQVISLTGAWFCCVRNPRLRLRRKEKTVFDAKILKTAFKIDVPVAVQEIAMNSARCV